MDSPSSPPTPRSTLHSPILPTELSSMVLSLPLDQQRMFNKVFKLMWAHILPRHRFCTHGGVLYSYWLVERIRAKERLSATELAVLTLLYNFTNENRHYVDSSALSHSSLLPISHDSYYNISSRLRRRGLVQRSNRDPLHPHLKASFCHGKKFIKLTDKGVALIKSIEKQLWLELMHNHEAELFGDNKKGSSPSR